MTLASFVEFEADLDARLLQHSDLMKAGWHGLGKGGRVEDRLVWNRQICPTSQLVYVWSSD